MTIKNKLSLGCGIVAGVIGIMTAGAVASAVVLPVAAAANAVPGVGPLLAGGAILVGAHVTGELGGEMAVAGFEYVQPRVEAFLTDAEAVLDDVELRSTFDAVRTAWPSKGDAVEKGAYVVNMASAFLHGFVDGLSYDTPAVTVPA